VKSWYVPGMQRPRPSFGQFNYPDPSAARYPADRLGRPYGTGRWDGHHGLGRERSNWNVGLVGEVVIENRPQSAGG
jgi:hypothetical protein